MVLHVIEVERIRNVKIVEDKSKIALFYISTIKIFALFENKFCQQMLVLFNSSNAGLIT